MPFLIAVSVWVAICIWVTVRIYRSSADIAKPGFLALSVWIIPLFGPLIGFATVRSHERAQAQLARRVASHSVPPPTTLDAPGVDSLSLARLFANPHGFPVLNWATVEEWLERIPDPDDRRHGRIQGQRAWLEHLRAALGDHYIVHESDDVFVLSSLEDNVSEATGRYVAEARRKITRLLGRLAHFNADRKSVLLVLDDEDTYYDYVSIFYPDGGEYAFSSGLFVSGTCPHFVARRADLATIEPVIAHELTHSALSHLELPVWLDEGIAVNAEQRITGVSSRAVPASRSRHQAFWNPASIQQFWAGTAFLRTDEANELAYDLARVMVEHVSTSWASFEAFAASAVRSDAGDAAARACLGVSLATLVCSLLDTEISDAWLPGAGLVQADACLE